MEKKNNTRKAPEQSGGGFNLWGIGIYVCLVAVIISLLFASCNGGEVYVPDDEESTPTPPARNITYVTDTDVSGANASDTDVSGTDSPADDTASQTN